MSFLPGPLAAIARSQAAAKCAGEGFASRTIYLLLRRMQATTPKTGRCCPFLETRLPTQRWEFA